MKKIITFLLLLMAWSVTAMAGSVTLKGTVLVPGQTYTPTEFDIIKTGSIEFSADGETLRFSNLVIECGETESAGNLFRFSSGATTVELMGENSVKTKGYCAFTIQDDVTITGEGSLDVAADWITFWMSSTGNYTLTIKDCKMDISGNGANINSNSGQPEGRVVIDNATVKGNDNIWCKEFQTIGVEIVAPEGAAYNDEHHRLMVGDNGTEGYLGYTILPVTNYNIWIAGKRMNSYNATDFKAPGVTGSIKYFEETNALIFENAIIDGGGKVTDNSLNLDPEAVGLFCDIDGLKIMLNGSNYVKGIPAGTSTYGMGLTQNTIIAGEGSLDINGGNMWALMIWNGKTLTLEKGCTVKAEGVGGIGGQHGTEKLVVDGAYVQATGGGRGSITDVTLEMNDAQITTAGAEYNSEKHTVVQAGTTNTYYSQVNIAPIPTYNYYIYVGGEQVNNKNCDDIKSSFLKSGKISYDFEENVLTLDNVVFDLMTEVSPRAGAFEIRYGGNVNGKTLDKLTVKLIGENTVSVLCPEAAMTAFYIDGREVTFTGGGTLNIKGNDTPGNRPFQVRNQGFASTAIFDGITLNVESRSAALSGYNQFNPGQFKFKETNATLTTGSMSYVFRFCEAIDFEDCFVETPSGAVYDAEKKSLVKDGAEVTDKVVIKAISSDPITIIATSFNRIYGDENPTFTYSVEGGGLFGDPVISCDATKASDTGEYEITLAKGSILNPNVTLVNGKLTIEKAVLTVTAKDAARMEGEDNPDFVLDYSGWKNDEDVTVLTTVPTATCMANATSPVGEYDIVPAGGEAKNYTFNYVNGRLTVSAVPVPVVVTVTNATRTYGDENPTFTYTVENGTLTGEPVITCDATAASPVGEYDINIEKGTITNDLITLVKGKMTIEKAELTVKAKDASREQGQPNPTFELEYTGWKNGEDVTALTTVPAVTCEATAESEVGTYDIVPAGGDATNYTFTYINGTLTVSIPVGINAINSQTTDQRYNLQGQRVNSNYRGVVIENGKKRLVK